MYFRADVVVDVAQVDRFEFLPVALKTRPVNERIIEVEKDCLDRHVRPSDHWLHIIPKAGTTQFPGRMLASLSPPRQESVGQSGIKRILRLPTECSFRFADVDLYGKAQELP